MIQGKREDKNGEVGSVLVFKIYISRQKEAAFENIRAKKMQSCDRGKNNET